MEKRKKGRPSKYNTKFHDKWGSALARLGYTDEQMAKEMGISESTLNLWKIKHKSFFGALKKGKDSIDDQVEAALCRRALGFEKEAIKFFHYQGKVIKEKYDEYYPPDILACIFWLKNRRPKKWRDKQEVQLSGGFDVMKFDVPIPEEEMKEARKQLQLFLKKGYDSKEDYTNGQST